jgi:transcriptional regulator with XRE-family HTH domain
MKKSSPPVSSKASISDDEEILRRIGKRIRELRRARNKNYQDFSKQHGINKVSLLRLEQGKNFTFSNLLKILKILDVSVEIFFKEI